MRVALYVSAAFLASCSSPGNGSWLHYSAPSSAPVQQSVQRAQSSVDAAIEQAKNLSVDEKSQPGLVALNRSLFEAKNELRDAQAHIIDLDKKVRDQTDTLNKTIDEKNAAITARDAANSHVHKLKFLVCSIAAAAAGLLVFQFRSILALFGPWGFIAYAAVPSLVFGLLWLRL